MKKGVFIFVLVVLFVGVAGGSFFIGINVAGSGISIPRFFSKETYQPLSVVIDNMDTRRDVVVRVSDTLGWDDITRAQFLVAFENIQWDAYNQSLGEVMTDEFEWNEAPREVFLTQSSTFLADEPDILSYAIEPGTYVLAPTSTPTEIVEMFIAYSKTQNPSIHEFLKKQIPSSVRASLDEWVEGRLELMPDMVLLPPQDVGFEWRDGAPSLVFSTTYYNIGNGPLEFMADPSTRGIAGDTERIVFQRIYKSDDTFRQKVSGLFEWHQEHLHYHFKDFIDYELTKISETGGEGEDPVKIEAKTTYCARDISRLELSTKVVRPAEYRVCGKERQGVSVGWGDTYFRSYPDQDISLAGLSSGKYKLEFIVNPENLFEEISKDNNKAHAILEYNAELKTVKVLSLEPQEFPEVQHIYIEY